MWRTLHVSTKVLASQATARTVAPAPPVQAPRAAGEMPRAGRRRTSGNQPPGAGWGASHALAGLTGRSTVTLSVDHGVVRVVVFKAGKVVAWQTSQAGAGISGNNSLGKDHSVASSLQALLPNARASRARIVTDIPLMAPLFRHVQLPPKMGRRYLQDILVSEVLESTPFTADEVDVAWQLRRDGQHNGASVAAVPKEVIDRHVSPLRDAGLRPVAVYAQATALAVAAALPDAIVVWAGRTHASLVLVGSGVPQAVHQVDLPQDAAAAQRSEVLAKAAEQVMGYYETKEGKDHGLLPVVLTGPLGGDGPLSAALQQALSRKLEPFAPSAAYPKDFPHNEFAVNLGLALADRARTRPQTAVPRGVLSVNLLPHRYLPRALPVLPAMVFAALVLAALPGVKFTDSVHAVETQRAGLAAQWEQLQTSNRQHKLDLAHTKAAQKRLQDVDQFTQALEDSLTGFKGQVGTLLARLAAVSGASLPPTVQLVSVASQPYGLSIVGKAAAYEDLLQFTQNLRASGLFASVNVVRAETARATGGPGASSGADAAIVNFQLKGAVASAPAGTDAARK